MNELNPLKEIDEVQFSEIIHRPARPALIIFQVEWLGSSTIMSDILARLAKEFRHKLDFVRINAERCPTITRQYGINTLPAILIFKEGEVIGSFTGVMSGHKLHRELSALTG